MASNMPLIDIGTYTDTGQVRSRNEDSLQIYPQAHNGGQLFVVADGVGGENYGQEASQLAVQRIGVLYYQYYEQYPDQAIEHTLKQVLTQVNTEIYDAALRLGSAGHMGTTAVVAVIRQRTLTVAWVGDSRVYVVSHAKRKARQITIDHSQVEDDVRAGILSREEAEHHPDRNVLSRSLGGSPQVEVDTITGALEDRDLVVLCSDGLTRYLNKDLISQHVLYHPTSQKSAETLGEMANEAGGKDNISVVIVHLGERASEVETLMPAYSPVATSTGQIPEVTRQNPNLASVSASEQSNTQNRMLWFGIFGIVAIVILILLFVLSTFRGANNAAATEEALSNELTSTSQNVTETSIAMETGTSVVETALAQGITIGQESIAQTAVADQQTLEAAVSATTAASETLAANATATYIAANPTAIPTNTPIPGEVAVGTILYTQRITAVKGSVRPPNPSDRRIPANTRVVVSLHPSDNISEFRGHYNVEIPSEGFSGWVVASDLAPNPPQPESVTNPVEDESVSNGESLDDVPPTHQGFILGQTVYISAGEAVYLQPESIVTVFDNPIEPGTLVLIVSDVPEYQTFEDGNGQWWWQIELVDGTQGYIEANYISTTP